MVHTYHLLGIAHDVFGIVAYALAICYYTLKLCALRGKQNDRQG